MEERAHALIAIVFIAVFGVGAGLVAWWMMAPSVSRVPYVLDAQGSVSGLGPGSPVNYRGVQVGAVGKVELDPDNRRHVNVRVAINSDFPLPKGTYATIAAPGLIGSKVVELHLGSSSADIKTSTASPAHFPLKPGAMAGVMGKASDIMASLQEVLKSARHILSDKNNAHISATLAHIDAASEQLVELEKAARPSVKAMPALIAQLQGTLTTAHRVLEESRSLVAQARQPLKDIGHAASAAGGMAVQMNQSTLPRLNALMGRLQALSVHLQALIQTLQRTPQSLIVGPAPVPAGPGETRGTPHPGGSR